MIVLRRLHFGSESVLTPGRETYRRIRGHREGIDLSYPLLSSPELEQVRRLMKVARTPVVEIKSASMNLSLRRHSPDARLHERQRHD
jgi:hypothetical protein